MASVEINVPDFNFAAFYYAEIYDALVAWRRANCPELTDESDHEPSMQLLAAYALIGHMMNCRIDLVANESLLRTAKLPESVRELLRLIGYEMLAARPAKVPILYKLAAPLAASTSIAPESSPVATEDTKDAASITFEADSEIVAGPSLLVDYVFGQEAGVFSDFTVAATDALEPDWDPWATPAVGDEIYFGHATVMWDQIDVVATTPGEGILGVWEVYDGEWSKARPDSVTLDGAFIVVDLTSYLGAVNRTGTVIRVQLNSSRVYEDAESYWDGSANLVQVGYLGQAAPSLDPKKYTVGSDWQEVAGDVAGEPTAVFGGTFAYSLPHDETRRWEKTTVDSSEAYWLRFRICEVAAPVSPTLDTIGIVGGSQYAFGYCTQGSSQVDNPLGNGNGQPSQEFVCSQEGFIEGSEEFAVDGIAWTRVKNFISTGPTDEVYTIRLGENSRATVVCAPEGSGKAPPVGVGNVAIAYRRGAEEDGNVGARRVIVDRGGLTSVDSLYNPRAAFGWSEAQGASAKSLEAAKQLGPATLRSPGGSAISPDDVVAMALNFVDTDGAAPFVRAWAVEEMFGPKTIGLVVVPGGGGTVPQPILDEVDLFFNGDKFAVPAVPKHIVANQEVVTINYEPVAIDVHAIITGTVEAAAIEAALQAVLNPEAAGTNPAIPGGGWAWNFGDTISESRIHSEIHAVSKAIKSVVLVGWSDVVLDFSQLPSLGTLTIEVTA